ncbi:MAG: hypothetical protein JWQ76_5443 [Ramlibacter sp.]|nr:hypothetical protein [Ramlibacter sp.]
MFDLLSIAVPFRMQPGLQRIEGGRHLTPLAAGSALWQDKERVVAAGASRLCVAGYDPQPALAAIRRRAQAEGLAAGEPIELSFEQDFAVLDGPSTTLPWLCVCAPSHWAPEDKLGLPFTAVHAPVADNQLLLGAARQLAQLVTAGGEWERFVWTITPSNRHDQHPRRQPRAPWPQDEGDGFAGQLFLRAERQTFFPLAEGSGQAVFTIHVMLQPLAEAVTTPAQAARLHEALATMSDAVLAYKGLAPARERLLDWLKTRGA